MEKVVDDVTFHDCSRIETLFGGGKDDARFVQVMQGHVKDRAKADAMFKPPPTPRRCSARRGPT